MSAKKKLIKKPKMIAAKAKGKPDKKSKLGKSSPDMEPVMLSAEEREEMEENAEVAAHRGSGGGSLAAEAAKAAGADGAATSNLKNFRHHPDMENFYRFIYENDLRFEALQIIDDILIQKMAQKATKIAKEKAH